MHRSSPAALAADSFTTFVRVLLLLFTILFTTFIQMAGAFDQDDLTEFYPDARCCWACA